MVLGRAAVRKRWVSVNQTSLVSGIKLTGKLRQFDQYTLLLQGADGIDSLIFKHAISTLIPGAPVVTRERRTQFGIRPEWSV